MSTVERTDLETSLHRLANNVETRLCDIIHELMIEGRAEAVQSIAWSASHLINTLREVRDGKEGDS